MPVTKEKLWAQFRWQENESSQFQIVRCECHGVGIEGLVQKKPITDWVKDLENAQKAVAKIMSATQAAKISMGDTILGCVLALSRCMVEVGAIKSHGDLRQAVIGVLDLIGAVLTEYPDAVQMEKVDASVKGVESLFNSVGIGNVVMVPVTPDNFDELPDVIKKIIRSGGGPGFSTPGNGNGGTPPVMN